MSKKNCPMDSYFQIYNIPRILIARNKSDLLELAFDSFDEKLHLPENLDLIENKWKNEIF